MLGAGTALAMGMTLKLTPGRLHPISVEPTGSRVTVTFRGRVVAVSEHALTLREASYPPVQYVPLADVDPAFLRPSGTTSHCPYKGDATYHGLQVGDDAVADALWSYPAPYEAVAAIKDHAAFYPDRVDAITVDPGLPQG
jgi:uncharacterized protein (DUF427 family)